MKKALYLSLFLVIAFTAYRCEKKVPETVVETVEIESVRTMAEEIFSKGELYCSEAVVHSINTALKNPYPENITKTASGFPVGLGKAKSLCGAVSGGEIALGMVYGRKHGEPMHPKMLPHAKELHDFIAQKYGSVICAELVSPYDFKSAERKKMCVSLTGDVADWVANKLASDTIDATRFKKEAGKVDVAAVESILEKECNSCPQKASCSSL